MRCDDFLPALETGGHLRRLRARCHAKRCPRCAAVSAAFAETKHRLATPEPLSPRVRQLWKQAADSPAEQHAGGRRWMWFATGLAAAACLVLIFVKWGVRPPAVNHPIESSSPAGVVVEEINPAPELSRLEAATGQLEGRLRQIEEQIARRDARREVAMTLDRFSKW